MATDPANPLAAGDTAELYRAAIGPRGQDYYLRQFTRFDAAGKTGASWHWPAYWNTLNWLAYRKMWGQALAYLAAVLGMALLVFGVGKLVFSYSDTTGLLLFLAFLTVAFVVPGLYANAWYYNFCNEKISAALRATQEVKDACEVLATQASSNKRLLGLASANVALMALLAGMVAFLFNPAQDFMQFAQGGPAKSSVPVMPEMAAGTQPVVAPPSVAASEPSPAPVPPAVTAEAPKPESPKPEAPAAAVPAEVAGLTSDTQIEHYLARMAEKAAAPSDETAAKAAEKAADKTDAKVERKPEVKVAEKAEPSPTVAVKAARASEPVRPAAAKTVQVAAASTDKPAAPKATSAKAAKADATKSDAAASAPKTAADSAAPASADKPKASAKASKTKKSWYVQAGAFAQEGNAQNVRLRIEAAGLETSTAPYETQAGRLIRVRVGPFTAKADAEKAALQVQALDLPAVLFKE